MKRITWDEYFINIAREVATRSDCIRAQVGAVIVNNRKKIKGTGYNNTPAGARSCGEMYAACYRKVKNIPSGTRYETCRSIHAEQNAIIQAGEDNCVEGDMYLYGHDQVCILCKRFIINVGIKRVFVKKDNKSVMNILYPEDWEV